MPSYDYRCTSCNNEFELTHGMREKVDANCPDCGAPAKKVFSPAGMVLKGSGFYNTDNRDTKHECSSSAPACPAAGDCPCCATE